MRPVTAEMTARWKSQAKIGDQRPIVRATVQLPNLRKFEYDTAWAAGGSFDHDRHRRGVFSSILFGDKSPLREIRNIKSYTWSRSVDQDVATCSLTLLNSDMQPIGNAEEGADDAFDMPGRFTYNRGQDSVEPNRWGYTTETGWQNVLVPDNLVKTYEGYGSDTNLSPENDPNLVQSGTWLIDKVVYSANGDITLEMRDVGRLLLDQIVFPPVVPPEEYPLFWSKIKSRQVDGREAQGGAWTTSLVGVGKASSSNMSYVGKGLTNLPYKHYVTANGGVNGHHASMVLTDRELEHWQSTGQDGKFHKVWWSFTPNDPMPVAAIRIHPWGGPYRIFVSIKTAKGWVGRKKIPYTVGVGGVDIKAGIPFVKTVIADRRWPFDVMLPRVYKNVTEIRLTFGHLQDDGVSEHPWNAKLRDIALYTGDANSLKFGPGTRLKVVGNYSDYTDIVKWVTAWAGFYWPPKPHAEAFGTETANLDFIRISNGLEPENFRTIRFATADPVLPRGRVFGDLMRTGTAGEADLTVDLFDKKPLMDVINYVRDLLGFQFRIDETGGVVWRMPNLWKLGNYLSPLKMGEHVRSRTTDIVTLDENETLLDWETTLSSENIRERIFVGNITGKIGTVIKGFKPGGVGRGFRRAAGWTDQNFETKQETRVMADMIAARQVFDFRRGRAVIPGYPAIQVDDQVRVYERVTNETYYHYVLGIQCNLDMESGEYTYTLDTHWLGERPEDAWVVDSDRMDLATKNYLDWVELNN